WTTDCQKTAQAQLNNGEADWQTLLRLYSDSSGQNRWQLVTPDQRAGVGNTVPGPTMLPSGLPFPLDSVNNAGDDPQSTTLTVCRNGTPYLDQAWVTLYFGGKAMDQGLTDENAGQITVLGAHQGDSVRAVSLNGALSGSAVVRPGGVL